MQHKLRQTMFWIFCVVAFSHVAQAQDIPVLEPGKTIERKTSSRETHTYQIKLTAGQFMRIVAEQNEADLTLLLVAPDGKQLLENNLNNQLFGQESLSYEAVISGTYKLVVRTGLTEISSVTCQIQLEVKDAATASDQQRVVAERLIMEALPFALQRPPAYDKSIEKLQQALPLWRELQDRQREVTTLQLISRIYLLARKFELAIENIQQALVIRQELQDHVGKIVLLNTLGAVYGSWDRPQQDREFREQALALSREIKHRAAERYTLNGLAVYYLRQRLYEKRHDCLEQILLIDRESKNRKDEAITLQSIGYSHYQASRVEKALASYDIALAIFLELKDRAWEGVIYREISNTYSEMGRYDKAIDYQERALAIWRETKNELQEGSAYGNLGGSYLDLGRNEKALEYFEKGLALYRKVKFRPFEGSTLSNIGIAHLYLGHYEKAIEYFEQALVIQRESRNRSDEAVTLNNLGVTFYRLGRHEKAIEYHEQGLAFLRAEKHRRGELFALTELANVWRALGQVDKSINADLQALQMAREIKARGDEAFALKGLMLDWKVRNQPHLAILFGKQAVNVSQEMRSNFSGLDRESQQSFIKSKEETYRDLADLLIAQGRLPEAEQVIRMLKEEEYFEYVRRDANNTSKAEQTTLTPEEAAVEKRYREIADKLTEIGTQRSALLEKNTRTPEEEKQLVQLETDLLVAGQTFQKFLDGLSTEFAQKGDNQNRMFQVRESQGLMEDLRELGKGTVALYTLVGASKFRIILTTADVQKAYEYPIGEVELNRKILALREALQNPRLDPRPAAQELYKIVFAPVAKDLQAMKATTLMWSLDGVLRYVPISALYDGEKYLVETYRHVVFTPASNARLKDTVSKNWQALGLGVTKSFGDNIPALPAVAAEMRGIIRSETNGKGIMPGIVKLDEAFTQESMLTGLRARPSVVHVASHFQFKPGNETDSALLLGDGKFLSLAQIKAFPNVFSGVELLTLSACNTATGGGSANGKEVEGFAVLAQRQGAKSVIASLWPVVDRTTRILMEEFYRSREANKLTKGEALRQAQLKLLRGTLAKQPEEDLASRGILHEDEKPSNAPKFKGDPKAPYAHPYYWAPFILIGNWK